MEFLPANSLVTYAWYEGDTELPSRPDYFGPETRLVIRDADPNGFNNGTDFTVLIRAQVPEDFSPVDPRNNTWLTNRAEITASNSLPAEDEAHVRVQAEAKVSAGITKSWTPATQPFGVGSESTISINAFNSSNIPVDRLIVTDPAADTPNGASLLSQSNPFRLVNFGGFDASSSLPAGAETVQTDAYVFQGGVWGWVQGGEATSFVLPTGVNPADVGGLRFTFRDTNGQKIERGAGSAASIVYTVEQRATDRITGGDLSAKESSVTNVASAQTEVRFNDSDFVSAIVTDDAPFRVTPPKLETKVQKTFDQVVLSKGESTLGHITASNAGSPVETLTVSDLGFFDGNMADWVKNFGGFGPVSFPAGAVSGQVTYYFAGTPPTTQTVSFADGTLPPAPGGGKTMADVTGFVFTFGAALGTNGIVGGATAQIPFTVDTNKDAKDRFGNSTQIKATNTADVEAVAVNGNSVTAKDTEELTVINPYISLTMNKNVRPKNTTILPGQDFLVELKTTATPSVRTGVKQIVVEDKLGDAQPPEFWNGFNLMAIRPTQVPAGYTATVEVQLANGTWQTIATDQAAGWFSLDEAAFAAAVAAKGGTVQGLTGVRFTYNATADNNGGKGTQGAVTVQPNLSFEARTGTLRDGSALPDHREEYKNVVIGNTTGVPPVGPDVKANGRAEGIGPVGPLGPGTGEGPGSAFLAKSWNVDWVLALSQQERSTTLRWNVDPGRSSVTITDPAVPANNGGGTVFDAFNLRSIEPISVSNTDYANGWYLKWDKIAAVELYDGSTGAWVSVPAPGGSWQNSDRSFKGYALTVAQQKTTTGLRIVVVPDDAARAATTDALAPLPGKGVASGVGAAGVSNTTNRAFTAKWQIRDVPRSDPSGWVTAGRTFNQGDGEVLNTATLTSPDKGTLSAADDILIIDPVANVSLAKTVNPAAGLTVPEAGSIDPANYPTARYTLTAKNAAGTGQGNANSGVSNAQWVRLIDPMPCAEAALEDCRVPNTESGAATNPWANTAGMTLGDEMPFNWLTITNLTIGASIPAQVDLSASRVTLLHYNGGTFSTSETTAATINAQPPGSYDDVVGFAVVFTSADSSANPAGGGGLITPANNLSVTVDTQLRQTLRNNPSVATHVNAGETLVTNNQAYAQLIRPEGVGPNDMATATGERELPLLGERVDIAPKKTISPDTLTEPGRHDPVTVTLSANQGNSLTSPTKVVLEDYAGSADFWNLFTLTSLGSVTKPAGADLVQVDAFVGGAWVTGTAAETAALPVGVSAADVTGLRLTFTKSGPLDANGRGPIFSPVNNPAWNASVSFAVSLRDTEHSGGNAITFPRDAVENTVVGRSWGKVSESTPKDAVDNIRFDTGARELAIGKWTNEGGRMVGGGSTIPWDIRIENPGTGYVNLTSVVDNLPALLAYTGDSGRPGVDAIEYTLPNAGFATPQFDLSADGKTLSFTWDAPPRLAPGESLNIRIWLQLQPGFTASDKAYNQAVVTTEQNLDHVYPVQFGDYTADVTVPDPLSNSASTRDYVQVQEGNALVITKAVRGSLPGAESSTSSECVPYVAGDGNSYYRPVCAANSTHGGIDHWVIEATNYGTTDQYNVFWLVDALPKPGDKLLASGDSRGSAYRPVLTGVPVIELTGAAPEMRNNFTYQYTYDTSVVCEGAWSKNQLLPVTIDNPPCQGNVWHDVAEGAGSTVDWSKVTGLRMSYNKGTDDFVFPPGAKLSIYYSTKNELKSDTFPEGADNSIPVADEYAWNQPGMTYDPGEGLDGMLAPNMVGVHLRSGSFEVAKQATGEAVDYAPAEISATAQCSFDGVALLFDETGTDSLPIRLVKNDDGTYDPVRIHGVPIGSVCTVTEDGEPGSFGESARSNPEPVTVTVPDTEFGEDGLPANDIPLAQVATITNTYGVTGLQVTKIVTSPDEKADEFGPFEFELTCEFNDGSDTPVPVTWFDGTEETDTLTFSLGGKLSDTEAWTWRAPADSIPYGAVCTLTETNNGGATFVLFSGDNVVMNNGNVGATITMVGEGDAPEVAVDVQNIMPGPNERETETPTDKGTPPTDKGTTPGSNGTTPGGKGGTTTGGGKLRHTGADVTSMLAVGTVLVGAGVIALVATARKRRD